MRTYNGKLGKNLQLSIFLHNFNITINIGSKQSIHELSNYKMKMESKVINIFLPLVPIFSSLSLRIIGALSPFFEILVSKASSTIIPSSVNISNSFSWIPK